MNTLNHVVSFSGGRTSAYLVYLIEQKRKEEGWNVEYIFMDTGAEHPKTYKFIRDVVEHFGIELTCLRVKVNPVMNKGVRWTVVPLEDCKPDLQPWKDMTAKYGTPYVNGAFCTSRMKTRPHDYYCNDKYGKHNWHCWLGMRADEPKRVKRVEGRSYLADISDFEKIDILNFWAGMPFDLEIPEWLGNCVFCLKKGLNKLALALKDEPEMYKEFAELLASDATREMNHDLPKQNIFRKKTSLPQIEYMYIDHTRDELIGALRGARRDESGSCSESCELYADE